VSTRSVAALRGRYGEELARIFLESCGLVCRARRFRCPVGEIDLVMAGPHVLVFVEVKTRGAGSLAVPEAAVGASKLTRMRQAARHWLWRYPPPTRCRTRFDVVAVELRGTGVGMVLRHHVAVR
jgi:putative endonuclease